MSQSKPNILYLATEYDAPGMRPYARTIINTMWQEGDRVLVVTRYGVDAKAFPTIPADAVTWIEYPTSLISKALFRFWPTSVTNAIKKIVSSCSIDLVYSLTGELILAGSVKKLQREVPLLYTVHDAVYHDYKFSNIFQWFKDRIIIAWPQQRLFRHTHHKVTNSMEQLDQLRRSFPGSDSHYAPFPTLVNDDIVQGSSEVPELKSLLGGYILFFGTLHLYKGVHLLYDAYLAHPELQALPLVIAGTKDIYFERHADEKNVIWINRFVDDSEVADLFSRAAVVVYPYISATQSGVTSIASYFGKPMVLSNLPFFLQTCGDASGVEFFPQGDSDALAAAISRAMQSPSSTRPLYDRQYSTESFRNALMSIVQTIGLHNKPDS